MRKNGKGLVLQDLDRLFRCGTVSAGDGALLESFLSEGNEAAFEALVNRHGPMIRGVCRRLLSNPHDVDDAFQATFLVLVRKGRRVRDPDRLGPWLHGVATREALRARAGRRQEQAIVDVPAREGGDVEWCDVMPIIDAELARLPMKHRDVLVACLLEGATAEEASHRLACPVGTVKSRLARARETLRARLASRGVAPALALAVLETTDALAFASPVSSALTRATLKTVTTKAVAPGVVALTKGVASAMISKSVFTVLTIAGVAAAGLGSAVWIRPSLAQFPASLARKQNQPQAAAPVDPGGAREAGPAEHHLKRILSAVHSYVARTANGSTFPSAAIADAAGQPLLSWRVAILPYLDQNELYQQFHLNEAWDSPHNKTLIERMPTVFEIPGNRDDKGYTRIRGFAGDGTVFDPALTTAVGLNGSRNSGGAASPFELPGAPAALDSRSPFDLPAGSTSAPVAGGGMGAGLQQNGSPALPRGVGMAEILDGTSYTVFVAIARDATVWTRPGELPFVPGQDLPALDESDTEGYMLGMCDGTVRVLKKSGNPVILSALISRAGGEIVSSDVFAAEGPQPIPLSDVSRPARPSSSVEQRLRNLEEKVDRILEKLDAR